MLPFRASGPGSNGNEGMLRIPQSSSFIGTSPSDCSRTLDWGGGLTPRQRNSRYILQPQPTGQLTFRQTCMTVIFSLDFIYERQWVLIVFSSFSYNQNLSHVMDWCQKTRHMPLFKCKSDEMPTNEKHRKISVNNCRKLLNF